jgi:hypothetical protein
LVAELPTDLVRKPALQDEIDRLFNQAEVAVETQGGEPIGCITAYERPCTA